jgi:Archaeal ATPase.
MSLNTESHYYRGTSEEPFPYLGWKEYLEYTLDETTVSELEEFKDKLSTKHELLVISGPESSGKSTLIKKFTDTFSKNDYSHMLPALIPYLMYDKQYRDFMSSKKFLVLSVDVTKKDLNFLLQLTSVIVETNSREIYSPNWNNMTIFMPNIYKS